MRGRTELDVSEHTYERILREKTASLFGWSAAAGAWAAGVRGEIPEALSIFGEGIGTAFQLVDDALDYAADPNRLGKKLGADLIEGKATLPLIRACEADARLRHRLARLVDGHDDAVAVAGDVIEAVKRTGGVDAAREIAREHTRVAMQALEKVPDGPHRRAMADAAQVLTERAF